MWCCPDSAMAIIDAVWGWVEDEMGIGVNRHALVSSARISKYFLMV